jgi:hypothetical protein
MRVSLKTHFIARVGRYRDQARHDQQAMVPGKGFEPSTVALQMRCSTN